MWLDNKTVRFIAAELCSGNACAALQFSEVDMLEVKLLPLFNFHLADRL